MNNLNNLLEKALQPAAEPAKELNTAILQTAYKGRGGKRNIFNSVPKVAVAALVLVLLCPMGVYAAKAILKQVHVTENMLSVGNEEFIDDAAVLEAMQDEEVAVEKISSEEGNDSVKWLRKEVEEVGGTTTNTYYYYDDFGNAMADSGLENWLGGTYELSGNAIYIHSVDSSFAEDSVNATFLYGEGGIDFYTCKMTGNIDENVTQSLFIGKTSNKRTYVSKAGYEFALVDKVIGKGDVAETTTYVLISYGDNFGFLGFNNMTEDEIKQVLDTVLME